MGPIDYLPQQQTTAVQNLQSGLQLGAGFQQLQQQQAEMEKAQQQAARMQAFRAAVGPALQAGDPAAMVQLFSQYPEFGEQIKTASGFYSDADENNKKSTSATVYNGLQSGNIEIAKRALESRVNYLTKIGGDTNEWKAALDALNSGDPDKIKQVQQQATLLHALYNPKAITSVNEINTDRRAEQLQAGKVREGLAGAAEAEGKAATTSAKLIGQTMGALENVKNLKPSQVATAFKSMSAKGIIGKDELPGYLESIPSDPAALKQFVSSYKLAGLSPEDQMKYTDVDANTRANNARIAAEGSANRANQLQIQGMIEGRQQSKANMEPSFSPETIQRLATQALRGDRTGLANIGRGAQGSANLVAVQNAMTAEGARLGLSPEDITARSAELEGLRTGLRATGNIAARVENAIAESQQLAPLAIAASEKVARSGLLPFGKAQIMFNTQTNDPDLAAFAAANTGLATAYASAMSRGNKPTVSDMEHARHLLTEAKSHTAYVATINQMKEEMKAASRAPQDVREHLKKEISGSASHIKTVPNPVQQGIPSGWSVKER